ncbi:translation initiation factor IF-2 [Streptomyces sp. NPDC014656]|uniref:translation initiation factor IF-2 n=1 Tax=Streptomyces sp. NPDC014656 TaxID=3364878 RepID=UPI0036FA81AF
MRRLLLWAVLLSSFTVGCGVLENSEDHATDAAREAAGKVGERLYGQRPRTAEEVGRAAAEVDGVEVLRVTGTSTHDGDGVDVVVRTSGSAYDDRFDAQEVVVRRCFAVRVSPRSEWREEPRDVDCPAGAPLVFPPPPPVPELPSAELRAKLPRVPKGGRAEEAEVRRALAALDLHPEIRTEVQAEAGRVGVSLSLKGNGFDPQDCVLALVGPGVLDVWTPVRIQRMPGEGGCGVGNALHPQPPPH